MYGKSIYDVQLTTRCMLDRSKPKCALVDKTIFGMQLTVSPSYPIDPKVISVVSENHIWCAIHSYVYVMDQKWMCVWQKEIWSAINLHPPAWYIQNNLLHPKWMGYFFLPNLLIISSICLRQDNKDITTGLLSWHGFMQAFCTRYNPKFLLIIDLWKDYKGRGVFVVEHTGVSFIQNFLRCEKDKWIHYLAVGRCFIRHVEPLFLDRLSRPNMKIKSGENELIFQEAPKPHGETGIEWKMHHRPGSSLAKRKNNTINPTYYF